MTEIRKLNSAGIEVFRTWLAAPVGHEPPEALKTGSEFTESLGVGDIDEDRIFQTRYNFGLYLNTQLKSMDFRNLMSVDSDGLWAWLVVIYFRQLAPGKLRRSEHYLVTRIGHSGSLAYRQAARTSYELVYIHGGKAMLCLGVPMKTFGDMAEQLASRQTIAHNRGFFEAASQMYVSEGKLRRRASSKPKKPKDRKPGDRTGFGGVRRLAKALQRLDLTFDTEEMAAKELLAVLPKEFAKWSDTD